MFPQFSIEMLVAVASCSVAICHIPMWNCPATGGCVLLTLVTLLTAVMSTTTGMPTTTTLVMPMGCLYAMWYKKVQPK